MQIALQCHAHSDPSNCYYYNNYYYYECSDVNKTETSLKKNIKRCSAMQKNDNKYDRENVSVSPFTHIVSMYTKKIYDIFSCL